MASTVNRGGDSTGSPDGASHIVQMPWYLGDGGDTLADEPAGVHRTPPVFVDRVRGPHAVDPFEPPSLELRPVRPSPATPDSASRRRAAADVTHRDGAAFVDMRALLAEESSPASAQSALPVRTIGSRGPLLWVAFSGAVLCAAVALWWFVAL